MLHPELQSVLDDITHAAASGVLPLVVFDLDSTLFSTRTRNLRILREFAATRPHDVDFGAVVASLVPDDFGWELTEPLKLRGIVDAAVLKAAQTFWFERFFTDGYVLSDTPTPGAVAFANAAHDAGAFVYYLTGRHIHGMAQGTAAALTQHGFPFWRGRCSLHLKPSFSHDDKAYKAEALADLRSHHGKIVATFENEPGNANMFRRAFPEARHFLLLTDHSPDPEPLDADIVEIPDFR